MSKRTIKSRAQELLALARKLVKAPGVTWVDVNNSIYGPGGPCVRHFPSPQDRADFAKTKESTAIDELIDSLPDPPMSPQRREYSGKFNVRIPKSLHAALANEAEAEGVSLNQLVLAKLAIQLRSEPEKGKGSRRSRTMAR